LALNGVWKTLAMVGVFLYSDRMTFDPHFDFAWLGPLYLIAVAWPLTVIDLRERRLPNRLTLPVFPISLLGQGIAVMLGEEAWLLFSSVLVAVIAFAIALVLNRFAGLGMGDVKLIAGIALALAWFSPFLPAVAILIAFVAAGAASLVLLALRRTRMGSSIALGPYLLFGFAVCFIAQGWS
jgi:leader peptidase (prepilin peptidase)/N-methyltransferase